MFLPAGEGAAGLSARRQMPMRGFVDQNTYQWRYNTCARCPKSFVTFGKLRCSICKCFMALKARLAAMHCPLGLW